MTRPGRLDILAAVASRPGCGQFRDFIAAAKEAFGTVAVWLDRNPVVGEALRRYGFSPVSIPAADGRDVQGWQWKAYGQNAHNGHETKRAHT